MVNLRKVGKKIRLRFGASLTGSPNAIINNIYIAAKLQVPRRAWRSFALNSGLFSALCSSSGHYYADLATLILSICRRVGHPRNGLKTEVFEYEQGPKRESLIGIITYHKTGEVQEKISSADIIDIFLQGNKAGLIFSEVQIFARDTLF